MSGSLLGGIAAGTTVTAAESTDRFIVDTKTTKRSLGSTDLEVVFDLPEVNLAVVRGTRSAVESAATSFAVDTVYALRDPDVNAKAPRQSATDEPYYPLQWDKQVQNIPEAQTITRGEGARIAIIDSGVTATHPDLEHAVNTELSRNFTEDDLGVGGPYGGYHGTHVAGIVAANDRNETGVVGTAPGAEIVDCRVFSGDAGASFASIVAAMVYSASIGCDAANMSIGAYPVSRKGIGAFYGKVLNRVMTYANSQGTVLVVSAGNDAADLQHDNGEVLSIDVDGDGDYELIQLEGGYYISLPNEAAQALSVAATGPVGFAHGEDGLQEPADSPAIYTNYGTNAITLAAPGGDYDPSLPAGWYYDLVLNTIGEYTEFTADGKPAEESLEYSYGWVAGTSMAAPQVAGAVALLKSQNPDLSANQVEATLKNAASVPEGYDKAYYGAGFLDVLGALRD